MKEKYNATLIQDETLVAYLEKIEAAYFHVQPSGQGGLGGILGGLFKTLTDLEDMEDYDDAEDGHDS